MRIFVLTRQNPDGTFDEVGMNNRTVVSGYKTYRNAYKWAINPFGNGRLVRVEEFAGSIHGKPIDVFTAVTSRS